MTKWGKGEGHKLEDEDKDAAVAVERKRKKMEKLWNKFDSLEPLDVRAKGGPFE